MPSDTTKLNEINRLLKVESDSDSLRRDGVFLPKESFEILGLDVATCEFRDIKTSYQEKSLLCHPDKCNLPGANDAFKVLQKAYEALESGKKLEVEKAKHARAARTGGAGASGGAEHSPVAPTYEDAKAAADAERKLGIIREAEERERKKEQQKKEEEDRKKLNKELQKSMQWKRSRRGRDSSSSDDES